MGLDSLLNSLKSATPATSCNMAGAALEPLPHKAATPATCATRRKTQSANNPAITAEQETIVRSWLNHIEEPEENHYLVLDKCKRDPEALVYFLGLIQTNQREQL